MRTNYLANQTTQFRVLTDDQIEEIVNSALEVLERTGARFYDEEALKLLKEAGAVIEKDNLAHLPSALVKRSLQSAPQRIRVSSRDVKKSLALQDHQIYFGAGSDTPFVLDPYSRERRQALRKDAEDAARLADYLPHIDFHMSLALIQDVPWQTYDRHQFVAMVTHTSKPLIITAMDVEGLRDILKMCHLIAGGEENFRRNPFIILYDEPSSPNYHSQNALKKLLFAAEKGIPVIYTPCPIAGATAPATLAGVLVNACAESLAGLVLAQLKRKGAPVIIGGVVSVMDMSTTVYSYGAPELSLLSAALTDVAHYLGVPMFSTAGCSDSKALDEQAALEASVSILISVLSGANLIHDLGYLEAGLVGSTEMLLLCDEIIGMVKRVVRGVEVNEETLALDIIHKVGPGGNFLGEDHTLRHFRTEAWYPRLLDRRMYFDWVGAGSVTLGQRVNNKTREILDSYEPIPLAQDVLEGIDEILRKADERATEIEAQKV